MSVPSRKIVCCLAHPGMDRAAGRHGPFGRRPTKFSRGQPARNVRLGHVWEAISAQVVPILSPTARGEGAQDRDGHRVSRVPILPFCGYSVNVRWMFLAQIKGIEECGGSPKRPAKMTPGSGV
jgi:hypothetical protein